VLRIPETPEERAASQRALKTPALNWKRQIKYQYGITPDDFDRMLADQRGRCAICGFAFGKPGTAPAQRPHIDHCHESGTVRALLCKQCNNGIAALADNPKIAERAAEYMRTHSRCLTRPVIR
jgi:hypothetical protein